MSEKERTEEDELKRAIEGLKRLRKERPDVYRKVMAAAAEAAKATKKWELG